MAHLLSTVLAASTVRNIGLVISLLAVAGFVVYLLVNIRAGRAEVGSEIELAPNRKPYHDDEALEGRKLNASLLSGLVLLGVIALGLPLYWLGEPSRMDGAVEAFDEEFARRGAALFATTAEGGFNCAGCHGPQGVGAAANYTITDEDGEFVATSMWYGPALNTVLLRFSEEEVLDILTYGRPFSPMPALGEAGGGPLTAQQLDELIHYMRSIQITSEQARAEVEGELRDRLGLGEDEPIPYGTERNPNTEVGEELFNMGRESGFAGGAYSCGRCHTRGWSITGDVEPEDADISDFVEHPDGSGAYGFSLRYPLVPRQFLTFADLVEFVATGSEYGVQYGENGFGRGGMPGYLHDPNTDDDDDGMMTEEMVRAIAGYVLTFPDDTANGNATNGTGANGNGANGNATNGNGANGNGANGTGGNGG